MKTDAKSELDLLCNLVDSFGDEIKLAITRGQQRGKRGWNDLDNADQILVKAIRKLTAASFVDAATYSMFLWWLSLGPVERAETLGRKRRFE
jgi:hypothetical protein